MVPKFLDGRDGPIYDTVREIVWVKFAMVAFPWVTSPRVTCFRASSTKILWIALHRFGQHSGNNETLSVSAVTIFLKTEVQSPSPIRRLVAFTSVDALSKCEKCDKNTIQLIRHDIPDAP